jgi:hypothetical protein
MAYEEVNDFLSRIGLGQYAEVFRQNAITSDLLGSLTDADLRELSISSMGHRKHILRALQGPIETAPHTMDLGFQPSRSDVGRVIDESTSVSDTVDAVDAVSDLSESVSIDDFADLESPIDGVDELGFSEVDDVTDSGLPDAEDLADKASGGGILGGVFDLF